MTVFASEVVDAMVGPFAALKHSRWELSAPGEVDRIRRAEDASAASALGCQMRWLGLPDAIYRGDRYSSDEALYGNLHAEEHALSGLLADELMSLPEWRPGTRVYVPLAVGSHVDHQLVFEAGAVLAARGVEVWAYEDLPYAIHSPGAVNKRLDALRGRLGPLRLVPISASEQAKLRAVGCYGSQLPVIFRFTSDWREALRDYARSFAQGSGPTERFWKVQG